MTGLTDMNLMTMIGGGAIIGTAITCWGQIKGLFNYLKSFVVVDVAFESHEIFMAVQTYLASSWQLPAGNKQYETFHVFIRPKNRFGKIVCGIPVKNQTLVYFYKWAPVFMKFARPKNNNENCEFKFSYIRYTMNPDSLIADAWGAYEDEIFADISHGVKNDHFRIVYCFGSLHRATPKGDDGSSRAELADRVGNPEAERSFMHLLEKKYYRMIGLMQNSDITIRVPSDKPYITYLAFPQSVMDIICSIEHWKKSKEWYKDRMIPWKRGILMYGRPGTGKTALVRALAEHLNMPLYVYDLSSFGNREFSERWRNMTAQAPCIALIEDIDNVFEGRNNKREKIAGSSDMLTFDCLLNTMDGVDKSDGILTIITTNDVNAIDEALGRPNGCKTISTRPGRIDTVLELGLMDEKCRRELATRILSSYPKEVERLVKEGENRTPAQFQDMCAKMALAKYWEEYEKAHN